jgi:hypothetical protein
MAAMAAIVLRRAAIRKDVTEEVRACIGSARLDPKGVRVQLLFGDPTAKRQPHCGLWVEESDAVLGTFSTAYEAPSGLQRVTLGFVMPRGILPPYELDEVKKKQLARALADILITDLERSGHLAPRSGKPRGQ